MRELHKFKESKKVYQIASVSNNVKYFCLMFFINAQNVFVALTCDGQ